MDRDLTPYNTNTNAIVAHRGIPLPELVARADKKTQYDFLQFFLAEIRNKNTRETYARHVRRFFDWCQARGVEDLRQIEPLLVSAYVEILTKRYKERTVQNVRSALVSLYDYLVAHGGEISFNPARPVRPPKFSASEGETPDLRPREVDKLFDSIDTSTIVGLRDRALLGTLLYTCGRVSAVVATKRRDFKETGDGGFTLTLHEKGGKRHRVPVHSTLRAYILAYLEAAPLLEPEAPLFRSVNRSKQLTERKLDRRDVGRLVKRRAMKAGIRTVFSPHSFRATGATALLEAGVAVEVVQRLLNHADPRTTRFYDRRRLKVVQQDIEKMDFRH